MHPLAGLPPRQERAEPGAVSVGVEPGAAVELGLNLEGLARLDPERRQVGWAGLEIKEVGRCAEAWNQASLGRAASSGDASQMPDGPGYPLLPIGRMTIIARILGAARRLKCQDSKGIGVFAASDGANPMGRFALRNLRTRPVRTALALIGLSVPILGVLGLFSVSQGLRNMVGNTLSQVEGVMIVRENTPSPALSKLPASLEAKIPRSRECVWSSPSSGTSLPTWRARGS